ncbi:phosphatidic acid phosphatase type 2/haloperoxidase [Cytidiella melzeri]|nr:phosphatidic acid phosphatase type 2/haloperoxidase [Cytidiella melzeri]
MSAPTPGRNAILSFLDRTSYIVTGVTALSLLYTRSAGVLYFVIGALVCSRVVKFTKRFVRQPRPLHSLPGRQKQSYGMPSTHSAVVTYYAVYTPLAAYLLPLHPSLPPAARILGPLVVVPWASAIAVSRVWLGHHTWAQVGAGSSLGVVFGLMWFRMWVQGINLHGKVLEETYLFPRH